MCKLVFSFRFLKTYFISFPSWLAHLTLFFILLVRRSYIITKLFNFSSAFLLLFTYTQPDFWLFSLSFVYQLDAISIEKCYTCFYVLSFLLLLTNSKQAASLIFCRETKKKLLDLTFLSLTPTQAIIVCSIYLTSIFTYIVCPKSLHS